VTNPDNNFLTRPKFDGVDLATVDDPVKAHAHGIADLPVAPSGTSSTTQLVRADDSRLGGKLKVATLLKWGI